MIAGLGKLMVDEILWRPRVHPSRRAREPQDGELRSLHRALRGVLRDFIPAGRVPAARGC